MFKRLFFISLMLVISVINTSDKNVTTSDYIEKQVTPKNKDIIAKLVIDKIGVNNYIYKYNSNENTVNKNVEILNGSILPDNKDSIVFLAAHSGDSNISYFNELDKLKNNDKIVFYYNNYKYTYKITSIYEEKKDGDIEVSSESNNQLVLTTCSPTKEDKQLIVSSNLYQKEKV